MLFQANQQIGNYTLIKKIGEGGFGEVWLAENHNNPSSEKVAIKLPRKEQIDLQAVKDEIFNWTLSGKHKNILPIIECETFGNQIAIVSEFAPDGSLQDLLKKHRVFSVADAVEIIIGILDGLAHLHNRKIIHRDLKPDNVLFQGRTPRLTDFGISRALPVGSKSATVSGTLSYMAPEAFDGKRTEKTDIWSVGVILYQMLAGNLPFPQQEKTELIGALVMKEPNALPDSVPPDLQNIIKKSLTKDSTKRYQTAKEMKADLKEALKTWESIETEQIIDEPIPILPTEDWQNISQSQLETEEYREEKEIPSQTTEPSILEENNETLPFGNSEQVEETKPYVNFFSSQVEDNQPAKTGRLKPEFDIPKPVSTQRKSNKLYFAVPAILLLLFSFIGGSLWLNSRANSDKQITASNTSTKDSPTPVATPTPLLDENKETLLIPFRKGDKWGFCDKSRKLIIPVKYDYVYDFSEGLAKVRLDNKTGFVDKIGKEVIPLKFDKADPFAEGLASVEIGKKMGFIDKSGNEIIPLIYDAVSDFSEGFSIVKSNNKYWIIDKMGNEIAPWNYEGIPSFEENLALVIQSKKKGFVNKKGEEIIPIKYDDAFPFSNGSAVIKLNGKWGSVNNKGYEIIPPKYATPVSFSEDLARVGLNGKFGYIDKTDKTVISFKYEMAESFSEGLAAVTFGDKFGYFVNWGFIDKTGKTIIPLKFNRVKSFSEGLAMIEIDEKCGFIDKKGKIVIAPKYDEASSFKNGLSAVELNGKIGFIDKTGKVVIPIKYDKDELNHSFEDELEIVKLNGKAFYIDKNGTEYYEP